MWAFVLLRLALRLFGKLRLRLPGSQLSASCFDAGSGVSGRRVEVVSRACSSGYRVDRGYSSMVESQPSKLQMRVRFPLPAPVRWHGGMRALCCASVAEAHIAQSVEHFLGKEEVTGSNPVMSSKSDASPEPAVCT